MSYVKKHTRNKKGFEYKNILVFLSLLLILGVITYVFFARKSETETNKNSSVKKIDTSFSSASNGSYMDLNGNKISLFDYPGNAIMIISWATWCPQCSNIMRDINNNFKNIKNLTILGINRAEEKEVVDSWITKNNLNQGIIKIILDSEDNFYTKSKSYAMPEITLYNCKGDLIYKQSSSYNRQVFLNKVKNNNSCISLKN